MQHRDDPDLLIIRARVHGDLVSLRELIPALKITRDDMADYPYRALVRRAEWVHACADMAQEVDWDNFKNEVTRRQGARRHTIYLRCWTALRGLESTAQRGRRRAAEDRLYGLHWDDLVLEGD